jgi:hypothetical protein
MPLHSHSLPAPTCAFPLPPLPFRPILPFPPAITAHTCTPSEKVARAAIIYKLQFGRKSIPTRSTRLPERSHVSRAFLQQHRGWAVDLGLGAMSLGAQEIWTGRTKILVVECVLAFKIILVIISLLAIALFAIKPFSLQL